MNDYSRLYSELELRINGVMSALRGTLTEVERAEVSRFLNVREYGLALDTLCYILVEEDKPIEITVLHEIDNIADMMHLRDERFMYNLHNSYDLKSQ